MSTKNKLRLIVSVAAFAAVSLVSTAIAQEPPAKAGEVWTKEQFEAARATRVAANAAGAAKPEAFFRAQEFSIDLFGSASVARLRSVNDLNDHEAGFGFGVNYFFTRNLGIGYELRGTARQVRHDFLNEGGLHAMFRLPIGTVAPYGIAGVGYEIINSELRGNVYAGAGLEVRLSPRVGVFTEARRVWEGPKDYDARAGVRFSF